MGDGRKNNGGVRPNSGRKKVHDEIDARDLSIAAIEAVHGSKKDGLIYCLQSGEASLIKFVLEHAFGKPTDKVQLSGDEDKPVLFLLDGRFKGKEAE